MLDMPLPDLTFPMVSYGARETRWDLRILLYKGGAKSSPRTVFNQIAAGDLGRPIVERIELVQRLHVAMTARLVGGGSKTTSFSTLKFLRHFFSWADEGGYPISLETVEEIYRGWCDFLLHRVRLREITGVTAYVEAIAVSSVLDDALDRSQSLILTTRCRMSRRGVRAVGISADKQNLAGTFAFGHLCLDIIESMPVKAIWGQLPLLIRLRSGAVIEQWSRLRAPKELATFVPGYKNKTHIKSVLQKRSEWLADRTLRTRSALVNLRLEAELLVFIAQTGMNLAQAHQLRKAQFSYKSTIDGYEVRDYKCRRQGEVLFEIFAEYKVHFNHYLAWRDEVFADESTDLLFPFIKRGAADSTAPYFTRLRALCNSAGVPYVGPQKLRKTRVNWLLRQSRNPEMTAELDQHTKETLLRIYEQPSLQVAQVEIIQFWKKSDPRLVSNPMPCPAPGVCDGKPKPISALPPEAPKPDCTHPAGCLFCDHHRDIDSEDYIWSAASMRHLNTVILAGFRPAKKGKIDAARHIELAIEVLTAKLKWFQESNNKRKAWVEEAMERIEENTFHPHWHYLIESAQRV
jgi:integrase